MDANVRTPLLLESSCCIARRKTRICYSDLKLSFALPSGGVAEYAEIVQLIKGCTVGVIASGNRSEGRPDSIINNDGALASIIDQNDLIVSSRDHRRLALLPG
jgi:hypothetical protein